MSRRPTHFPTTVADCHELILALHAELDQLELHTARLREDIAARRKRSAASKGVSEADHTAPSLSFQVVFPLESDRHVS